LGHYFFSGAIAPNEIELPTSPVAEALRVILPLEPPALMMAMHRPWYARRSEA
jgi:hypothetical protein